MARQPAPHAKHCVSRIQPALALLALLACLPGGARGALPPPEHPLFSEDAVHEIHLTFHQADWWDLLVENFEGQDDPIYLPAEFDWADVHYDSIGVRFKGNSSYFAYPGVKKSFKLDIDEYVEGQEIHGLDKVNLNNAFMDPSFVREPCCYELCEATGLATVRTNYAALYINGTYWGLYVLVEQVDQEFLASRFGPTEDGNLWKGDPKGTLEYLGPQEELYYDFYELENHEEENDWSALVRLADGLNNTPTYQLIDSLHAQMDVNSALAMLAVDLLTVNLDSYLGRCCNYYVYQRTLDGRMTFINWDVNEAWGVFNQWGYSVTQLEQLSPFWSDPRYGEDRPLGEVLWPIPEYESIYVGHLKKLMATAADPDTLLARMEVLRDLIRPYVYADPNKMFSNSEFEAALTSDIQMGGPPPGRIIPGLDPFIRARHSYLLGQIGAWTPIEGLALNELMASNGSTVADEAGDFDDWLEVTNHGALPLELGGLTLADHHDGTPTFLLPEMTLAPGAYLLIWADEEPGEGPLHAPFKLDGDGEELFLIEDGVILDQLRFPALASDQSYGRWPDGTGSWTYLAQATPADENENTPIPEVVVLYLNEFVALNDTGITDETGAYEDWLEIYNPGPDEVALGGLYLTDDLSETMAWSFPDTTLAAGGFLLVWCDDDPEDGPLHATFKLSGDGEEIGLFGRIAAGNEEIDSYVFGPQTSDVSEGRESDGSPTWVFFEEPTPGASNGNTGGAGHPDPAGRREVQLWPRPMTGEALTLQLATGASALRSVSILDIQGRRVRSLWRGVLERQSTLRLQWDGRDDAGQPLGEGVYFLRCQWGGESSQEKLVIVR